MSTFVYDLVSLIDDRWQEVQILIEKALEEQHTNVALYDALCRANVLLIVAHLEAFVKDIAKAIVSDINAFSRFSNAPVALKRTFCKTFIDPNLGEHKEIEQKVQRLIEVLDGLETKFIVDPFLVESAFGNNKNPSPTVINKICVNFGVRNIFSWINNSNLDIVFNGISSEISTILLDLKSHVLANTASYPYSIEIGLFGISEPTPTNNNSRSFWETFLDQLLKSRNDIAHGSLLTNSLSVTELIDYRNKVLALEYALVLVLCHKSRTTS